MSKPRGVLWALEPHSAGKHIILREYLNRWLPILADHPRRMILIDGFAGPGRYLGGEDGSPVIMLKALLEHRDVDRISRSQIEFHFVEANADRAEWLRGEVAELEGHLPPGSTTHVHQETYQEFMAKDRPSQTPGSACFAFVDPFGYPELPTITSVLEVPRGEALIYFPITILHRFVGRSGQEPMVTALFGDEEWRSAAVLDGVAREAALHNLFRDRLKSRATHVRSFEIVTAAGGSYHLFFATNNELGLAKMKEAMWKADTAGGQRFRDSTDLGQLVLFDSIAPDTAELSRSLAQRFGGRWFTIEQAERHTLIDTPYLPDSHLKRRTLQPLEAEGRLEVIRPAGRRRGTFTAGTRMRFTR